MGINSKIIFLTIKVYFILFCFFPSLSYGDRCRGVFFGFFKERPTEVAISTGLFTSSEALREYVNKYGVNARSVENGNTALHIAVDLFETSYKSSSATRMKDYEIIADLLIIYSADPYIKNGEGKRVIDSLYFQKYLEEKQEAEGVQESHRAIYTEHLQTDKKNNSLLRRLMPNANF